MDITEALAPTSDQLDAIELVSPRTFTIDTGSRLGKRDGKTVAEIRLVGFDRVWRPSKGMLDVLAACWGTDAKQWVGKRVTVYNDPEVMFGRDKVGGIRISHLSDIDSERSVSIRASGAGRRQTWKVQPLTGENAAHPPTGLATQRQKSALGAHVKRLGLDKDAYLKHATECAGRIIAATDELTETEADALVTVLAGLEVTEP